MHAYDRRGADQRLCWCRGVYKSLGTFGRSVREPPAEFYGLVSVKYLIRILWSDTEDNILLRDTVHRRTTPPAMVERVHIIQ